MLLFNTKSRKKITEKHIRIVNNTTGRKFGRTIVATSEAVRILLKIKYSSTSIIRTVKVLRFESELKKIRVFECVFHKAKAEGERYLGSTYRKFELRKFELWGVLAYDYE